MIKVRNALFTVLLSVFFVSCAKLPIHQSQKVEKEEAAVIAINEVGLYDSDNKLKYGLFHDSEHLYISLVFLDPMALKGLKSGGLNIYLDPKGKQKKEQGLCFPVKEEGKSKKLNGEAEEIDSRGSRGKKIKLDPERMLSLLPEYAIWKSGKEEQVFRWRIENYPCRVRLKFNKLKQLEYQARIPLDLIFPVDSDRKLLAVGLECESELPKQAPAVLNDSGARTGGGRRAPAGMKGGGSRSGEETAQSTASSLDLWFKVKLED
jgi:hypothetical protein